MNPGQTMHDEPLCQLGVTLGLKKAAELCEERARKHEARGSRLDLDKQAEADACAYAIRKELQRHTARSFAGIPLVEKPA